MTTPERSREETTWDDLSPWDKAAQWYAAAPHISDKIMALAEERTRHRMAIEANKVAHSQKMDHRVWITQIVTFGIGVVNVIILAAVAWHYADTGNIVPGLTVFGAGAGLTAGAYGAGRAIGKAKSGKSK